MFKINIILSSARKVMNMAHHPWKHSSNLGLDLSPLRPRGLELPSHSQVGAEEEVTHMEIQMILLPGLGNPFQVNHS